jgi:hypothetical protein
MENRIGRGGQGALKGTHVRAVEQGSDGAGDLLGLCGEPGVGEPDDAMARELQGGVASAITLEGRAGAVELVAVELDYQALGGPEGIDLEARDESVDCRARQAGLVAEVEEAGLELRACGRLRKAGVLEQGT